MDEALLQHLAPPNPARKTYGTITFDPASDAWVIDAEPQVVEFAKRVFPGSRSRMSKVRFHHVDRWFEHLTWLMLRYPLEIHKSCQERFHQAREKAVAMALRREGLAEAPAISDLPSIKGRPYPYQLEDAGLMVAGKRVLNASGLGVGKTVEAFLAIDDAGAYPALIVVQPHVQHQWMNMIKAWVSPPVPGSIPGTDRWHEPAHLVRGIKGYDLPNKPLIVIHYGILHAWNRRLQRHGFRAVVFDEIQEMRRTESKKYATGKAIADQAEFVWGLSGTPIKNYGIEMHHVMNVIEHGCLGSKESFQEEWCMVRDPRRVRHPEKLRSYLIDEGLMFQRRQDDPAVNAQLPAKRRITVEIDQDEDLYAKLVAEAARLATTYENLDFVARGRAARMMDTWTRKAAGVAKAKAVADFVKALVVAGERVVLGAHHHDVHDILTTTLGKDVVRITGRETTAEKERAKQRFMAGEVPVVILALRAAEGVDGLQKRATCVVFGELDWSPQTHQQFEGRVQRHGLVHQGEIPCYYLVAGNSYDAIVQGILGLKAGQFAALMDEKLDEPDPEKTKEHLEMLVASLKAEAAASSRAAIRR